MATATATITYDNPIVFSDNDQHSCWMYGTVAIQASPATYATGGLALAWGVGDFPKVNNQVPDDVFFYSANPSGTTTGGYGYMWNKATNKFVIMAATTVTAGTGAQQQEMTNTTAIPANISGDTIRFEARFSKAF